MKSWRRFLDRELGKFLHPSKMWLIRKGYVSHNTDTGEYQWTEEGLKWINSLKATNGVKDEAES